MPTIALLLAAATSIAADVSPPRRKPESIEFKKASAEAIALEYAPLFARHRISLAACGSILYVGGKEAAQAKKAVAFLDVEADVLETLRKHRDKLDAFDSIDKLAAYLEIVVLLEQLRDALHG